VKRIFVSDCEGPISKNDNAFEITASFVPDGDKLFTVVSKYDDFLADVIRKPGYSAGDTLKLILPFLKAYGVTEQQIQDFSARNLVLIRESKQTLQHIRTITEAFIVSTSYEQYIRALCQALEFPFESTYCTKLKLDKYPLNQTDTARLREIAKEIACMPVIKIPESAKTINDFNPDNQKIIAKLNEIFWGDLALKCCKKIFSEVTPIGGVQKATAIKDAAKKSGVSLSDVMYVGDSITDVEAFKLISKNGGLAISFNGNKYAICNAEIAVISESSAPIAAIADVFIRNGKTKALNLAKEWTRESLEGSIVNEKLLTWFFGNYPRTAPQVKIITTQNRDALIEESSEFRKKVRGAAVGKLG
jgi:energy-converting hydrogenase A subunit R